MGTVNNSKPMSFEDMEDVEVAPVVTPVVTPEVVAEVTEETAPVVSEETAPVEEESFLDKVIDGVKSIFE